MNVPKVPPPCIITLPTLLINSRPRKPYLNFKNQIRLIVIGSNFANERKNTLPKCRKSSKQGTGCHSNTKANCKSCFHFRKTARLLTCTAIHTSRDSWHIYYLKLTLCLSQKLKTENGFPPMIFFYIREMFCQHVL